LKHPRFAFVVIDMLVDFFDQQPALSSPTSFGCFHQTVPSDKPAADERRGCIEVIRDDET